MGRGSPARFFLAALLLAVLSAGLVCEAYLRWFSKSGYLPPAAMKEKALEFDSTILRRYVFPQKEKDVVGFNGAKWHISRWGYRGPDFEVPKPKGTLRIMIYGGSQTFDMQEKDWPHRVERLLRRSGHSEAEVINAGSPGHMSYDSFEKLFTEGHTFSPDYVILNNVWNDLGYFDTEKPFLRAGIHPMVLGVGDPRVSYFGALDRLLCGLSHVYGRLRDNYLFWRLNREYERVKRDRRPSSRIGSAALKQYRLTLELFVDCARDIGAVPILMIEPRLVARHNTDEEKRRIGYEHQPFTPGVLCDALDRIDQTLLAVSKAKGVPLIDASAQMTGKGELFEDHIHLSGRGSARMSEIVARSLEGILRRRRAGGRGSSPRVGAAGSPASPSPA